MAEQNRIKIMQADNTTRELRTDLCGIDPSTLMETVMANRSCVLAVD